MQLCFSLQVLEKVEWPAEFPFSKDDFRRYDEQPDAFFYVRPSAF